MLTNIVAIVGIAGVIGSVLFAGLQSRAVARQTRIQNAIATAASARVSIQSLDAILQTFITNPDLRDYFYSQRACPPSGPLRAQVLTLAEMFADVLSASLYTTSLIPADNSYDAWLHYAKHLIFQSPALHEMIADNHEWWPRLAAALSGELHPDRTV
jgi:hypothetical protein